jgi:predicted RNA binding protein YcfA (HicA-like mRNA interferase family)
MAERFSSVQIVWVLESLGFRFRSQKGSHAKFRNEVGQTVIVPMNKKIVPAGTLKSILNQAGLSFQEFKEREGRH